MEDDRKLEDEEYKPESKRKYNRKVRKCQNIDLSERRR